MAAIQGKHQRQNKQLQRKLSSKCRVANSILESLIRQNSVLEFMQGAHFLHGGPWNFYDPSIAKAIECRSTYHEYEAELKELKVLRKEMEKLLAQNTQSVSAHPDEYYDKLLSLFFLIGGLQTSTQRPSLAWWSWSLVDVLCHIVDKKLPEAKCRHVWRTRRQGKPAILTRCFYGLNLNLALFSPPLAEETGYHLHRVW